jgi:pimeloyl-ACP methyl ester carboxylesterase
MTTAIEPRTASVNGVDLRYVDTGAGDPPIVFVHGWTCNRTNWRHQIAEFSQGHRVIALDQRGHGESEKPDQDYTIEGFADDLTAFVEDLGLERPVLVGHSMGGAIAHRVVRTRPGLARALVTVDSTILPIPEALSGTVTSVFAGLRSDAYKEVARGFSSTFLFGEKSETALKEELLDAMAEAPHRLVYSALESLLHEAGTYAGPSPVPTLCLLAATSIYAPDAIKERYPNVEVRQIDAAHFLQLERPTEVNEAIREFLARPEVQA